VKIYNKLIRDKIPQVNDQIEELADLVELVYAVLDNKGVSLEDFEKVRLEKREERGGFEHKLLLLETD